jgi:hypothetical protein
MEHDTATKHNPVEGADSFRYTIDRAAMLLLAMSAKPDLKPIFLDEVTIAVATRGGIIDDRWHVKSELRAAFDAIVERAVAILAAALNERLHGIAD